MSLPVITTSYTWQRASDLDGDSGDALVWSDQETGIPGTPSYFSGSESVAHGDRERADCRIFLDTLSDIRHYDRIVDEGTGETWEVAYSRRREGLGLDHLMVGGYAVKGIARSQKDL